MAGLGILGIGFVFLAVSGLVVSAFVFWILMLIDCCQRKFDNKTEQLIWVLILLLTHLIGAFIYRFMVKKSNPEGMANKSGNFK